MSMNDRTVIYLFIEDVFSIDKVGLRKLGDVGTKLKGLPRIIIPYLRVGLYCF